MDSMWLTTRNRSDGNATGIGSYSPSRRSRIRNSGNVSTWVFASVAGKNRTSASIPAKSATDEPADEPVPQPTYRPLPSFP
jgi:hypothetical protein